MVKLNVQSLSGSYGPSAAGSGLNTLQLGEAFASQVSPTAVAYPGWSFNPFTLKIWKSILLTDNHTFLCGLSLNVSVISIEYPLVDNFRDSHYLPA